MGKELEVKVLNVDLKEMEEKIKRAGGALISEELQVNTLIDSKEKYIENNLNSYLRIRETKNKTTDEVKVTLTLKKNMNREGIRENIETDTDISNKEAMLEVLKALGYEIVQEGFKERTSYKLENIRFDLDKWDERTYPYPYMEIEVEKEEDLEKAIKLLDIPRENISTKSIVELRNELNLLF